MPNTMGRSANGKGIQFEPKAPKENKVDSNDDFIYPFFMISS